MKKNKRFILYAPNVHVGGGFILLKQLLGALLSNDNCILWLDERAKKVLNINENWSIYWVKASLFSRFISEFNLFHVSEESDVICCFHGLPPILNIRGKVNLFFQNRNYLGTDGSITFSFKTRLRLKYEQIISKLFINNVCTYWVQTPSMRNAVIAWAKKPNLDVRTLPFCNSFNIDSVKVTPKFDFIYVADGEAHKNHKVLVESWKLLANYGIYPSLLLTLPSRNITLKNWILDESIRYGLNITDIGEITHEDVQDLYLSSNALIFPSKSESFGLPLIESARASLPILAGELDFVRDVCCPVETFDPNSPVSIYRAVRRFLLQAESPLVPKTAHDFLEQLFKN